MRLIETSSLELIEFPNDAKIPRYAILSHTWEDAEVSFQDVQLLKQAKLGFVPREAVAGIRERSGFLKIARAADVASNASFRYLWVDTCCIDKTSSAELSEAINSMFRWYKQASLCYAYLSDVKPKEDEDPDAGGSTFRRSRWFTRGWTLQELIAPIEIVFLSSDWHGIEKKTSPTMCHLLSVITGVDTRVLAGSVSHDVVSVANRMRWAAARRTTRSEDIAYCLMGLFNVNMPLLYGEGGVRAFLRLQEEIMKETEDQSLFAWDNKSSPTWWVGEMCGLLAESPASFSDVGNIRPLPPLQTLDSVPSSMTNQGLRLHLYLQPARQILKDTSCGEDDYLAFLDCSVHKDGDYLCPTLVLRKLWGDQFGRIPSHGLMYLRDPRTDDLQPSQGGYRSLFVKKTPKQFLPDFTVSSGGNRLLDGRGAGYVYWVQEVYPSERWDASSLLLSSDINYPNLSISVLRFADEDGNPRVDVAVGLHNAGGVWKPWCWQNQDVTKTLWEVENDAMRVIEEQKRVGKNVVGLLRHSDTSGTATVKEITRHGRPFFQLEVVEKPEIDGGEIFPVQQGVQQGHGAPSGMRSGIPPPRTTLQGPKGEDPAIASRLRLLDALENAATRVLASCCVSDAVEVSIFPTGPPTTKIRVAGPEGSFRQTPWRFYELVITAITNGVQNPEKPWPQAIMGQTGNVASHLDCLSDYQIGIAVYHINMFFHQFAPLHLALVDGNYELMHKWLLKVQDLPVEGKHGLTLAHIAAILSRPIHDTLLRSSIVHFMTTHGSNEAAREALAEMMDARTNPMLDSALHFAAAYGHWDSIDGLFDTLLFFGAGGDASQPNSLLLSQGQASLRGRNRLDETPLHRACAMGNTAAVRRILKSAPDSVADVDRAGRSTVWHAAAGGHADIIPLLVAHGALVDLADNEWRSPLHAACREGHEDVVRVLLQLGADPEAEAGGDDMTFTPVHVAALFGHDNCLLRLKEVLGDDIAKSRCALSARWWCDPIHLAAANGHKECVMTLLPPPPWQFTQKCARYVVIEKNRHEGEEKENEKDGGAEAELKLKMVSPVVARSAEEIAAEQGYLDIMRLLGRSDPDTASTADWTEEYDLRERRRLQKWPSTSAGVSPVDSVSPLEE